MASLKLPPLILKREHAPVLSLVPALTTSRLGAVARAWRADVAGLGTVLATVALVYWPSLTGTGIYARSDTFTFFFPAFATLHQSLRLHEFPLWTPYVFGGFPLFAEGQIGALYPPNLAAAVLPSAADAFLLLRVFHVALAASGTYVLARVLHTSPLGGIVAALAFGLGSFVVGQQHHANLLASTSWLPLILAAVELTLRAHGWLSLVLTGITALLFGVQSLATHVQPSMLSGALIGAFILTRQAVVAAHVVRERGGPACWCLAGLTVGRGLLVGGFIAAVGALIAAAQLLPLYELSQESWRATGFSYQDAIEYSFPPINLVTLLFPFFFRAPDGGQWSLWQVWEVVLYVGVVPLVLAVLAALTTQRWSGRFFIGIALASGVIALGGYLPFGLYEWLVRLPGMNVQRAPARFTLLTTLALAMLAGYGADWLARADPSQAERRRRWLVLLHLALVGLLATLTVHLVVWRAWLETNRTWALEALGRTYLALSHDPLQTLTPLRVLVGLNASLDLATPKTAFAPVLLGAFALLVLGWRELPRLAPLWRTVLLALVILDLAVFASDFQPLAPADVLGDLGPPGGQLLARGELGRILTRPSVKTIQPNELLPYRVEEADGYSPLQLARHKEYVSAVERVDNTLLDLWGVRWIVEPSKPPEYPSYQQVGFDPRQPLMIGGATTPNGRIGLQGPNDFATEVRMVLALDGGTAIPDGATVGELTVTDWRGARHIMPIRAGREVADWTFRAPNGRIAHRPVQAAGTAPVDGDPTAVRTLSFAEIRLPRREKIALVEYRHVNPVGETRLYGVALFDAQTDGFDQLMQQARFNIVYRDAAIQILENTTTLSRAYVVPEAVAVPDGPTALQRIEHGPFDPNRQVTLEGASLADLPRAVTTGGTAGLATVVAETTGMVVLDADAPSGGVLVLADAYYPDWHAYLDGEDVPVLRANYLFRGIVLPPGFHHVVFRFEPASFARGLTLSAAGLACVLGTAMIGLAGLAWRPWLRRRTAQRRGTLT
ncbi:MAG: YfhO family protein [Chloroflexi bacterium]|nr:YfhO family protein [Chloroflexota bacterium]